MLQHRAEFDAVVTFTGGGGLQTQGLRVDVPHADVTEAEIAAILVTELRLPAVARVDLSGVRILAEPLVPVGPGAAAPTRFVELNHVIADGTTTHPAYPPPVITAHLTWAESRPDYAEGTEFSADRIDLVGQTGTYVDSPRHRYPDGADLAGLPLERLADLRTVVVRTAGTGRRAVDVGDLEQFAVAGRAVLLHTGGDQHWGTERYTVDNPYLTGAGARWLVEHGAALVGIDSLNLDDPVPGGERPAHTVLLAAGIPIVEHLTGLADLPPTGARFTAVPPRMIAVGTFPVRAYAIVPAIEPHDHRRSAGHQPGRPPHE